MGDAMGRAMSHAYHGFCLPWMLPTMGDVYHE